MVLSQKTVEQQDALKEEEAFTAIA